MSENLFSDLVHQLEHTVQDITHSQSVSDLKHSIDETIRDVKKSAQDVAKSVQNEASAFASGKNASGSSSSAPSSEPYRAPTYAPSSPGRQPQKTKSSSSNRNSGSISDKLAVPANKLPGRSSGVLLSIGGVSCAILSGFSALYTFFSSVLLSGAFYMLIAPLTALGIGIAAAARGFSLCARSDRYRKYLRELRDVTFCSIKELSESVKKKPAYVTRDLEKMIKRNFFHEGHLDTQKTTFILDHETYQHYLQLEQKARAQKEQQAARATNPELDATIREGMECIRKIKEANDAIPGEVISQKLSRLETVVTKIFDFTEKHPERLSEIRRFTTYYLPTTLKLVSAYREFDAQAIQGETVQKSKQEIENTLDIINQSFETMFDNLFQTDARDVSADISVLRTMLKQEGLEDDGLHSDETK